MKKIAIESSLKNTLRLVGAGEGESGSALSPFGPVKAGLITMPTPKTRMGNQDQVLTELLNSLEREVASLVSKSSTLCDMLSTATQEVSAALSSIAIDVAGTEV